MPQEEDIDRTLQGWGIWEEGLDRTKKEERFARFEGVEFGQAPRDRWPDLRRDLL
jgi:hypothetical protein